MKSRSRRVLGARRPLLTLSAVAVTAAVALTGCSSGDVSGDTTAQATSSEAQAALDIAYAGFGGDISLDPTDVPSGVTLYVISCGQSNPGCAEGTASLVEGGEAAGWDVHVADGQLNPEGFATAIRQAIAAGADVIIPMGFGCNAAQAAFKEAHDAGITIVGGGGPNDCDPPLWNAVPQWLEGVSYNGHYERYGQLGANWAYGVTNGDTRAITLTQTTNSFGPVIIDAFTSELQKLGGEVVANVDFTDAELGSGSFIQKVTTALLANPTANVLEVPGPFLTGGLYQAIAQSGRQDLAIVVGGPTDTTILDLIRSNGSDAGITLGAVAIASRWSLWGSVDTAIRTLDGQPLAYIGDPMKIADSEHNLPESGDLSGTGDWQEAFLTAWGRE